MLVSLQHYRRFSRYLHKLYQYSMIFTTLNFPSAYNYAKRYTQNPVFYMASYCHSTHYRGVPRGSHWLMQRVPSSSSSSSSSKLLGGEGEGGGGREALLWCFMLTLSSLFSLTRPSHYVVGDTAGCEQLVRVPETTTGHVRTRYYMVGYTYLSFSVSFNPPQLFLSKNVNM